MSAQVRRILIAVVVLVVLYFVISQPEGAAEFVRNVIELISEALSSIVTFIRSLF
jgi:hypothetical protein